MKSIKRHKTTIKNLDWQIKAVESVCNTLLKIIKEKPYQLGMLSVEAFNGFAFELAMRNDEQKAFSYFKLSYLSALYHFKLACLSGEKINIDLGEIKFESGGYEISQHVSTGDWIWTFAKAVILRDQEGINFLINVPESVFRRSSVRGDEYNFKYVEFIKSLWNRNRKDKGEKLLDVYNAIEPENLKTENRNDVLRFTFTKLSLYTDYLSDDKENFNKNLEQALRVHRELIEENKTNNSPEGFFDIVTTSIAAMAHTHGWIIEVESDYMPKELVEGKWYL